MGVKVLQQLSETSKAQMDVPNDNAEWGSDRSNCAVVEMSYVIRRTRRARGRSNHNTPSYTVRPDEHDGSRYRCLKQYWAKPVMMPFDSITGRSKLRLIAHRDGENCLNVLTQRFSEEDTDTGCIGGLKCETMMFRYLIRTATHSRFLKPSTISTHPLILQGSNIYKCGYITDIGLFCTRCWYTSREPLLLTCMVCDYLSRRSGKTGGAASLTSILNMRSKSGYARTGDVFFAGCSAGDSLQRRWYWCSANFTASGGTAAWSTVLRGRCHGAMMARCAVAQRLFPPFFPRGSGVFRSGFCVCVRRAVNAPCLC
jgi:hypothetical protein